MPMTAPVMQVARVPATIAFMPRPAISARRSGAMVAGPAIRIPSEPKVAELQSA